MSNKSPRDDYSFVFSTGTSTGPGPGTGGSWVPGTQVPTQANPHGVPGIPHFPMDSRGRDPSSAPASSRMGSSWQDIHAAQLSGSASMEVDASQQIDTRGVRHLSLSRPTTEKSSTPRSVKSTHLKPGSRNSSAGGFADRSNLAEVSRLQKE